MAGISIDGNESRVADQEQIISLSDIFISPLEDMYAGFAGHGRIR